MRRHPRLVTATDVPSSTADLTREHLAPPERPRRWKPWYWVVAAALHVLAIALLLFFMRQPPEPEALTPPGVEVVFDNGGEQKSSAPSTNFRGPTTQATAPPPATPPPPPSSDQNAEVNLDLPEAPMALSEEGPALQVPPVPQTRAPSFHRASHTGIRRQSSPRYAVMNGMSLGTPSPVIPGAKPGMNLSLPQTDAQAVEAQPEFTVKGNVGPDWNAAVEKWGEDHVYYPDSAAEQGQQGDAVVEFTIDHKGHITGLHLIGSSGSTFLDQAWLGLFTEFPLPPVPPEDSNKTETVDFTMSFRLIQ